MRYVLEGSVRKADQGAHHRPVGGCHHGYHLGRNVMTGTLQDIFALQDEMTQKILVALKVKLTPEEQARFRHCPTSNLEAYDAFLRGGESSGRSTQEGNAQARQLFERTIALDPQYAAAYAPLGRTYFLEWDRRESRSPGAGARPGTDATGHYPGCLCALAHRVLCAVYLRQKQYAPALAAAERALALGPNEPDSYAMLAQMLNSTGQPAESHRPGQEGHAPQPPLFGLVRPHLRLVLCPAGAV